jgi:serine/threonine protein kinase
MPELAPGAVFAGHRIEAVAGRGGMGVVYRATHLALDHVVALKVISPELAADEIFRERFRSESRIAVSIRHPNVVPIHHAGEEDGLLFVTMDFIEGTDLRGVLNERGRLDPPEAASIVFDVAAALDVAHSRGLVHRDIKPGNVLIERRNGDEHVYLTDFGLTKQIGSSSGVTASGAFVGTLDYVAPEQIKGDAVDARADIYALGCVLFELLTGSAPFASREEKVAKIYAHIQDEPPSLLAVRPDLPPAFEQVVLRALAKDPDLRQPSAGDLARGASAAVHGDLVSQGEHSVAIGAAAPTRTHQTQVDAATIASESAQPSDLETTPATAVDTPQEPIPAPARRPPTTKKRNLGPFLLAGGAIALAVAAFIVISGSGGSGGSGGGKDGNGSSGGGLQEEATGEAVHVGGVPVGVAVVDELNELLVANREANKLDVLTTEGENVKTLAVGSTPQSVDAGEQNIWVTNTDDGTVSQFRQHGLAAAPPIQVGATPLDVAVGNHAIWVAGGDGTISRIQPTDSTVFASIPAGGAPQGIAATQDTQAVWFSDRGDGTVRRVDTTANTAGRGVAVGKDPKGVLIDGSGAVWVAVTGEGNVVKLNADGSHKQTFTACDEPRDLAAGLDSIWVTCGGDDSVVRLDAKSGKPISETPVGGSPEGIDYSETAHTVWVAVGDTGELVPITPN